MVNIKIVKLTKEFCRKKSQCKDIYQFQTIKRWLKHTCRRQWKQLTSIIPGRLILTVYNQYCDQKSSQSLRQTKKNCCQYRKWSRPLRLLIYMEDGDNFISKAELEFVMGDIEEDIWKQILFECDSDEDGKISLEEFIGLLKSKVL